MSYPSTWSALQQARASWAPPEGIADAFAEIAVSPVPYLFCTKAFNLLSPLIEDLDNDGVGIALGVAHMINATQFDQRHGEALAFLIAHAHRYQPAEAPHP